MSNFDKTTVDTSPERIDEIMRRARRERSEAITQLFGFGFTAAKDAVRGVFTRQDTPVGGPTAATRS